jgi:hemolysin activation/secretion protein
MPTDLQFPFEYDSTGDAATVSGQDFYEQHALILAGEIIPEAYGEPATANDLTEITNSLQQRYRESPYFATPLRVDAVAVDGATLTIRVQLGDGQQFEIPLNTRDTTVV